MADNETKDASFLVLFFRYLPPRFFILFRCFSNIPAYHMRVEFGEIGVQEKRLIFLGFGLENHKELHDKQR